MRKKNPAEPEFDIAEIPAITGRTVKGGADIPQAVVNRLPVYFRRLRELINRDVLKISSEELADICGVTASQLRQDMKYFGGLGQRGYGYNVMRIYNSISETLGVGRKYSAVIIGAGDLGTALCGSRLFEQRGVWVKGVFDVSKKKIGKTVADVTVSDASELKAFCRGRDIDIAVICCPSRTAEELYGMLRGTGVRGVWNFSPSQLDPAVLGVPVVNICTGDSLMMLTHEMSVRENGKNENKDQL